MKAVMGSSSSPFFKLVSYRDNKMGMLKLPLHHSCNNHKIKYYDFKLSVSVSSTSRCVLSSSSHSQVLLSVFETCWPFWGLIVFILGFDLNFIHVLWWCFHSALFKIVRKWWWKKSSACIMLIFNASNVHFISYLAMKKLWNVRRRD